jgi:hypothetical protein
MTYLQHQEDTDACPTCHGMPVTFPLSIYAVPNEEQSLQNFNFLFDIRNTGETQAWREITAQTNEGWVLTNLLKGKDMAKRS